MKTTDDMVRSLRARKEIYDKQQQARRKRMTHTAVTLGCVLAVCFVCLSSFLVTKQTLQSGDLPKTHTSQAAPSLPLSAFTVTEADGQQVTKNKTSFPLIPFTASKKNPTTDSFGEDELQHIDILTDGSKKYTQVQLNDYATYNFPETLSATAFGKLLGTVTELHPGAELPTTPASQEPSLAGSEVYLYAPVACEGVLVVKKDNRCSFFVFTEHITQGHSLQEVLALNGIKTTNDIAYIEYSIQKPSKALTTTVSTDIITDSAQIQTVLSVLQQLTPYSTDNPLEATPQWLNEAREVYNQTPENMISAEVNIKGRNGLVSSFFYEPNLGSGYITGHLFLTPKDNLLLQGIFNLERR